MVVSWFEFRLPVIFELGMFEVVIHIEFAFCFFVTLIVILFSSVFSVISTLGLVLSRSRTNDPIRAANSVIIATMNTGITIFPVFFSVFLCFICFC